METLHLDAIVVGSGPAGSTAALRLAKAGVRVAVVEKQRIPRYKTCGGGVVGRALAWAEAAVTASCESRAHRAQLTFSDMHGEYELRDDAALVHLVMRDRFDQELLRAAQRSGAQLLEDCAVTGAQWNSGKWLLDTSRGALQAPVVVAADGVNSRMARAAGWQPIAHRAPALEWEIHVDDASLRRNAGTVRFDFDADLRGYAWVFPKRDRLSVGVLSTRHEARDLTAALWRYLASRELRPTGIEKHAWMIPIQPRAAPLAQNGVFLVGDAAGLVDPITCEGISAALASGDLAGRCLQQAGADPRTAMALYEKALQADLLVELRWARRLARVLYGPRRLRQFLFDRFGQVFCDAMGSVISGRQSYHSLFSQPRHLRRLLAHRSAAPIRVDSDSGVT